jgi:hypothetical protein
MLISPILSNLPLASARHSSLQDDLFIIALGIYFSHVHQQIMESWKAFAESQAAIAKDNKKSHEAHQRKYAADKAMEFEGEKRRILMYSRFSSQNRL